MENKAVASAEVAGFLEKYNYFHDALLKSIELSSKDSFSGHPPALAVTGDFCARLQINHYNYASNQGQVPVNISVALFGLGSISFSDAGRGEPARHWAVTRIEIEPADAKTYGWQMTILVDSLDAVAGKWEKSTLAKIEFLSLKYKEISPVV